MNNTDLVRVISIKQPYAYLCAAGIKDVENRTWSTKYRGRVYIHASAKPCKIKLETEDQASVKEIQMLSALNHAEENELFSAIIGYVDIVDCVKNSNSIWAEPECYYWKLENSVLFNEPIRDIKGKLGIWYLDKKVVEGHK